MVDTIARKYQVDIILAKETQVKWFGKHVLNRRLEVLAVQLTRFTNCTRVLGKSSLKSSNICVKFSRFN